MTICICLTISGKQCKNHVKKDNNSKFCWLHQNCKKTITETKASSSTSVPLPRPIPIEVKVPMEVKKPEKSIVKVNSAGIPIFKEAEEYYTHTEPPKLDDSEEYKNVSAMTLIKNNPDELDKVFVILKDRNDLHESELDALISAGWDINKASIEYPGESMNNPLGTAAEYRNGPLIELLLKKGADPNIISGGHLAVELVVSGHSAGYYGTDGQMLAKILNLLSQYGAKLVMRKWFYQEFLEDAYYRDPYMSRYISIFKTYDVAEWPTYE